MDEIIMKKLVEARKIIASTKMKKEGKNTYSNYTYFTPEQVHHLVNDACQKVGLFVLFEMIKKPDENYFGILDIYDLDSDSKYQYSMPTDIPQLKATNITQQIGGAMTFTERYCKMVVFGIVENNLDFDASKQEKKELIQGSKDWNNAVEKLKNNKINVDTIKKHYIVSEKNEQLLINIKS